MICDQGDSWWVAAALDPGKSWDKGQAFQAETRHSNLETHKLKYQLSRYIATNNAHLLGLSFSPLQSASWSLLLSLATSLFVYWATASLVEQKVSEKFQRVGKLRGESN